MKHRWSATGTLALIAVIGLLLFFGRDEARSEPPSAPVEAGVGTAALVTTPGTLDPSWAPTGTPPGFLTTLPDATANKMAVQTDGKLVVVGSTGSHWFVARFNPDGTYDAGGFGTSGQVTLFGATNTDSAYDLAIQPDGRIVVAGSQITDKTRFTVVRLNANGTLDATFGTGGIVQLLLGVGSVSTGVAIQPDNKIVVSGHAYTKTNCFAVARLTPGGVLDPTFGKRISKNKPARLGYLIDETDVKKVGSEQTGWGMMALAPNGKILLGGYHSFWTDGLLAQYTQDGDVDSSFGSSGRVWVQLPSGIDGRILPRGLAVHGSGSSYTVYLSGRLNVLEGNVVVEGDAFVASYNPDGTSNTSFAAGFLRSGLSGTADRGEQVVVQSDGKVVLGYGVDAYSGLFRFNADGSRDVTYGNNGQSVDVAPPSGNFGCFPVALDPLGGVYLGGRANASLLAIARFNR